MAAVISVGGVMLQINAEDERSSAEFLREKQQAAYVELLTKSTEFSLRCGEFMQAFEADPSNEILAEKARLVQDSYWAAAQARYNARIVGSGRTSYKLRDLESAEAQMYSAVQALAVRNNDITSPPEILDRYREVVGDHYILVHNDLIDAAREDMGVPPNSVIGR